MSSYSEQFTNEVRKRLDSLMSALEEDLPRLGSLPTSMTFAEADQLLGGLDSALEAYRSALKPFYGSARRPRTSGQGTGYYQRRREREEQVARLAQEAVDKQGYVIAASIVTETGYRENTVEKVLEQVAQQQGWERRRDRETRSYRYSPKAGEQPQPPGAEAGT